MSYKSTARSSEKKEASDFEFKRHIKDMNSRAKISLIIVFSLIGIFLGADLMVKGGVALARHFGISPWIVGITVFAIGTSLPELATSLTASIKKIPSVGMGNIVGSNIFNVLLVLGTVALIRPVALEASLLRFEFPALLIFTVALIVIMRTQFRVSRLEGLALFLGYVGFIVLLLVRS